MVMLTDSADVLVPSVVLKMTTINISEQQFSNPDTRTLKHSQDQHTNIRFMKEWIEMRQKPHYKEITSESYFLRTFWNQWPNISIENDLLIRRWENTEKNIMYKQVIAPLEL